MTLGNTGLITSIPVDSLSVVVLTFRVLTDALWLRSNSALVSKPPNPTFSPLLETEIDSEYVSAFTAPELLLAFALPLQVVV